MSNKPKTIQKRNAEKPYLRIIFSYLIANWKIFAISLFVCLAIAVVKLKMSTQIYQVTAKVLLKDDEKGSFTSQTDVLMDFGFRNANTNVENEIEVLKSKSVVRMAILASELYVKYTENGFFVDRPIYRTASPITAKISSEELEHLSTTISMNFTLNSDSLYQVIYKYRNSNGEDVESAPEVISTYPYMLKTPKCVLELSANENAAKINKFSVSVYPLNSMVGLYKSKLIVSPISKTASVSIIAFNDALPFEGVDFINSLISCYNIQSNEDKNIIMQKTKEFVDARIEMIGTELKEREENLAEYKKKNKVISPTADVAKTMQNESFYVEKLEELNMQLEQSEFLLKYISNPENNLKTIPTMLGLANEATLVSLITKYNAEIIERNKMLDVATGDNPILLVITETLENTQKDIKKALITLNEALVLRKKNLENLADKYTERLAVTPSIELEIADLTRERDIKAQLYVMLLQKYEENALALAATADNLKCIDSASFSSSPVLPNRRNVILMAIAIGLFIPTVYVYLKSLFHTKLENAAELEELTSLPIIGSVPLQRNIALSSTRHIVVEENKNDVMAEAFRTIRTNMQFVMKDSCGKVIMFTSTTSGEGKTFVSANYAVSLAFLGKKVLYMGLDIRRPRLAEIFKISSNADGITTYLAGNDSDVNKLSDAILPSGICENLDLLPAGIIPPNPAELLARENVEKAIEYVSSMYDYIVMDTAPVGLVTDSIVLSRVADAIVYILRVDYTDKSAISYLNSLVNDDKLKNVSLVLNAENLEKRSKSYGYYGNSGYIGYGYSTYGYSGYSDDTKLKKKKHILRRKHSSEK